MKHSGHVKASRPTPTKSRSADRRFLASGSHPAQTISEKIERVAIDELRPYPRNPRTHSTAQIDQIARSIQRFGFTNPVLIDGNNLIIAGHGRLQAARSLGYSVVPVLRIEHLSEAEKRAYILADNRLAENAGWDRELLAIELQGLIDLDFDVELTGFEMPQIDLILEEAAEQNSSSSTDDIIPEEVAAGIPVSRPGDGWVLGHHVLVCANALEPSSYDKLLDGAKAEFVFTDPPYNVPIEGHVCGLGRIHHPEFAMACGEMSEAEFTGFLAATFKLLVTYTTNGSIHDICMDWRHAFEMLTAGRKIYAELKNLCIWKKTNAGMGSFYRGQYETVFVWKNGTSRHINNFELGQHGRSRSNVWEYAGVNTLRPGRMEELSMHPTVKPVALVADAIKDCSRRGGLVLDVFAGSGTVLIAAERTGRKARAMEIDPHYCDVAVRRWQALTGKQAVHLESGVAFTELEEKAASSGDRSDV
ncbi:MAG: site-specific DNA-methyltransferase [Xanthobacteraceae bacterium]